MRKVCFELMAIFELTQSEIRPVSETTFSAHALKERGDLQRLLRARIDALGESLLVIAEEFGDWEDARRRIDLLAVDRDANLVVIELKRADDSSFMDLQALRYAAMVSTMTFDQAVDAFAFYRDRLGIEGDAREALLAFLDWPEPDDDRFGRDVRIVLAAGEFSRELTTSVMWLNRRDMQIRCVRLKPYSLDGRILLDIQQVIPLPEAAEYQIRIAEKEQKGRESTERHGLRWDFWKALLVRAKAQSAPHSHLSPTTDNWISISAGRAGLSWSYVIRQHDVQVELYIDVGSEVEKSEHLPEAIGLEIRD